MWSSTDGPAGVSCGAGPASVGAPSASAGDPPAVGSFAAGVFGTAPPAVSAPAPVVGVTAASSVPAAAAPVASAGAVPAAPAGVGRAGGSPSPASPSSVPTWPESPAVPTWPASASAPAPVVPARQLSCRLLDDRASPSRRESAAPDVAAGWRVRLRARRIPIAVRSLSTIACVPLDMTMACWARRLRVEPLLISEPACSPAGSPMFMLGASGTADPGASTRSSSLVAAERRAAACMPPLRPGRCRAGLYPVRREAAALPRGRVDAGAHRLSRLLASQGASPTSAAGSWTNRAQRSPIRRHGIVATPSPSRRHSRAGVDARPITPRSAHVATGSGPGSWRGRCLRRRGARGSIPP